MTNTFTTKFPRVAFALLLGSSLYLLAGDIPPDMPTTYNVFPIGITNPPYVGEYEVTPSIIGEDPNSKAFRNAAFRLIVRVRERTVAVATCKANDGGRIASAYDFRTAEFLEVGETNRAELRQAWRKGSPLLEASYSRSRVFHTADWSPSDEWMTVFASGDRKCIVAVRDGGPIYSSEDSGSTWKKIARSGNYEFTLNTTPKGSAFVAVVSLTNQVQAASEAVVREMTSKSWYSVVLTSSNTELVLSGSPDHTAPALSISRSLDSITLAWPASFTSYTLQQSSDLAGAKWIEVTNRAEVVETQNVVTLPVVEGRNFFRLATP